MSKTTAYVLGHSDFEIERLRVQAAVIGDITRRLIRECGIEPGMRVLDVGCGAGDVSLLLAEAVGPGGHVVAIDREARAIDATRAMAETRGYRNIEAIIAAEDAIPLSKLFDAALGRYVLVHQPDPVAMIRQVASAVRLGGVIAFHELPLYQPNTFQALPRVDLFDQISSATTAVFQATVPSPDVAGRLVSCFEEAGLPSPHLIWECIAGDYASPIAKWLALNYRSMLPHVTRLGLTPPDVGDPDTLVDRLDQQLRAARAQVVSRPQVCAWVVRP
jgi:SAM-dependent methyltransferase